MTWVRRNWGGIVSAVSLLADLLGLFVGIALAYYARYRFGWFSDAAPARFLFLVPVILCFLGSSVIGGLLLGLYSRYRTAGLLDRMARGLGMVAVGSVLTVAATFFVFVDRIEIVREIVLLGWLSGSVFVVVGRSSLSVILRMIASKGLGVQRVLIVGAGAEGQELAARLVNDPSRRYKLVGFLDDLVASVPEAGQHLGVLGRLDVLGNAILEHEIDKVMIAIPSLSHEKLLGILSDAEASYADVWLLPDLFQLMVSPVIEGGMRGLPLIAVNEIRLRGLSRLTKRLLDIVVGMVFLTLASVPMVLIGVIIKMDSKGPAFYVQRRVGRDGREFSILKYRTMVDGADEYGQTWTVDDDPRQTRFGRFLRRYWIDELPQLINVVKGDMSLVGPRPEQPDYVSQFTGEFSRYMVRHRERAGMTGWAQVNGRRGNSSIGERTRYDIDYVENWSILFDLRILLRTAVMVVRGDVR